MMSRLLPRIGDPELLSSASNDSHPVSDAAPPLAVLLQIGRIKYRRRQPQNPTGRIEFFDFPSGHKAQLLPSFPDQLVREKEKGRRNGFGFTLYPGGVSSFKCNH